MSQTSPKTPSQPLNSDVYVILEESPDAILVRCPTYQQPPDPKDIKSLFVDQHPYFNVGHLDLVRITATDAAKTSYLFAQKMAASIIANIMGSWESKWEKQGEINSRLLGEVAALKTGQQATDLSLGRLRRQRRAITLMSTMSWILDEGHGRAHGNYKRGQENGHSDHELKLEFTMAFFSPPPKLARAIQQGRVPGMFSIGKAVEMNEAVNVEDRNGQAHLDGNLQELVSALLEQEAHIWRIGGVEGSIEGWALSVVALLLGKTRLLRVIRDIRARPLDFDPLASQQLKRLLEIFK